jgi:hypothetical protein
MYACILGNGRGFFKVVCRLVDRSPLFATHPTLAFANNSMPVIPPVIRAAANLFIHCCYILCLAISRRVENGLFSVHIGVGLCRIVDMSVGEFTF